MQNTLKEMQQQLNQKDEEIQKLNISIDKFDQQLKESVEENKRLNEKVDRLEKENETNFKWCFDSITKSFNLLLILTDRNTKVTPQDNEFGTILPLLSEQEYEDYIKDTIPEGENSLKTIVYKNEKYSLTEPFKYSYEERAGQLLESMQTGSIHRNGKNEMYFKLPLNVWQSIVVELQDNIAGVINQITQGEFPGMPKIIFASDCICLVCFLIGRYHRLWIQKTGKITQDNTSIFLLPIKETGEKLHLKLGAYTDIPIVYKNEKEEVLLQIQSEANDMAD